MHPSAAGESVRGKRRARRLREIDFSRPTKFTQEQLRRIERAHESFCRTAAMRLTGEARTEIELEVVDLAQLTWTAALSELPASSIYGVVKLEPVGMHMLVATELNAVRAIVDRMLGSTELRELPAEQELTEIELAISRRVLDGIVEELSRTWEELLGVTLAVDWIDVQLQNLQLAPPSEPTIALTVQLRLEELTASLGIVLPPLDRVGARRALPTGAGDLSGVRETIAATAARSPSRCPRRSSSCVWSPRRNYRCRRARALQAGDHLELPRRQRLTIAKVVLQEIRRRPGRRGNHHAVEVLERRGAHRSRSPNRRPAAVIAALAASSASTTPAKEGVALPEDACGSASTASSSRSSAATVADIALGQITFVLTEAAARRRRGRRRPARRRGQPWPGDDEVVAFSIAAVATPPRCRDDGQAEAELMKTAARSSCGRPGAPVAVRVNLAVPRRTAALVLAIPADVLMTWARRAGHGRDRRHVRRRGAAVRGVPAPRWRRSRLCAGLAGGAGSRRAGAAVAGAARGAGRRGLEDASGPGRW